METYDRPSHGRFIAAIIFCLFLFIGVFADQQKMSKIIKEEAKQSEPQQYEGTFKGIINDHIFIDYTHETLGARVAKKKLQDNEKIEFKQGEPLYFLLVGNTAHEVKRSP